MKEKKFIHLVFYLLFNLYIEYVDLHLSLVQRNDPYYHSEISYLINIPKTKCEYPILSEVTKHSIEVAVAVLYGPGLNEPGNTVIVGHNYRNGMFFSNNKKLVKGDMVYITSATETVGYEIYNIYQTSPDDAEYMRRDTGGAREISLSTCTDDSSARLIIWAREKAH